MNDIYEGNIEITKENAKEWEEKLKGVKKITGDLRVDGQATLNAPALVEVGGDLMVDGQATLPAKNKIGKNPKPIFERFKSRGYLLADGILCRIISQRKSGKMTIYKTNRIGNRRKIVYVVQKGNIFSHGETVKKASHDLRYKLSDRDTTKYKGWTLDSVHTSEALIGAYRVITGACETGTRQYCEGKKLPAKMSVKVAIRLTRGAWGGMAFEDFFKEEK